MFFNPDQLLTQSSFRFVEFFESLMHDGCLYVRGGSAGRLVSVDADASVTLMIVISKDGHHIYEIMSFHPC